MATNLLYGHGLFRTDIWSGVGSLSTQDMNTNQTRIAWVSRFPKAGSITDIGCYCTAVTGSGFVYDARLEGVTGRNPSGALISTTTNKTFTPSAGAWAWQTLTSPYTATLNEQFAVVITDSSGVDGSNYATLRTRVAGLAQALGPNLITSTNDGGSWTRTINSVPVFGLRYSDGTIWDEFVPLAGSGVIPTVDLDVNSTPDEYGNKWVCPVDMDVDGAQGVLRFVNGGSEVQYSLYDSGGTDLVTATAPTRTEAADVQAAADTGLIMWNHPVVRLTAGATYYCAIRPLDADDVRFNTTQLADLYSVRACFGDCCLVTRTNGGAWTETAGSFIRLGPKINGLVSGGGLLIPGGFSGGMQRT